MCCQQFETAVEEGLIVAQDDIPGYMVLEQGGDASVLGDVKFCPFCGVKLPWTPTPPKLDEPQRVGWIITEERGLERV
jgi:hypothetical protein